MSDILIKDYLQTQGLQLPIDEVKVAKMAIDAVMNLGQVSIDEAVLWRKNTVAPISEWMEQSPKNDVDLKKVFMALDTVFERTHATSASVYALCGDDERQLHVLATQGEAVEEVLSLSDESALQFPASRAAQTGWLSLVDSVEKWLDLGDLVGEHHRRAGSQMTLPITLSDGRVAGVLHVEDKMAYAFTESEQIQWVALALALAPVLVSLLNIQPLEEDED